MRTILVLLSLPLALCMLSGSLGAMEECKKVAERRSQKTNGHASTGLDNSGESDNGVEKEEKEDDSDSYDDEERSVLDCVYSDTSSEE